MLFLVCLTSITSAVSDEPTNNESQRAVGSSDRVYSTAFELHLPAVQERPTVPESLEEAEHLQKRSMRLMVPFVSRRYAAASPEEDEAEQGFDNQARSAMLASRLDEVLALLREANVDAPVLGFGRPAPLIVTDLGESPSFISAIAAGPAYPQVSVAGDGDAEQAMQEVFRPMDELTDFVTIGKVAEPASESIFSKRGDEVPVLLPY